MEFFDKIEVLLELKNKIEVLKRFPRLEYSEISLDGNIKNAALDPHFECFLYGAQNSKSGKEILFCVSIDYDERNIYAEALNGQFLDLPDDTNDYNGFFEYLVKACEIYLHRNILKTNVYPKEMVKKQSTDHLYLIHDTVLNTLKIGRSKNPKDRVKSLQISTANSLKLLHVIQGEGEIEKRVHGLFSEFRLASEWFCYSKDIINYFTSHPNILTPQTQTI